MTRLLPVVAAASLLAACATLGPSVLGPSLFGPSTFASSTNDTLRFPHSRHVAAGVDCTMCHEAVPSAKNLEARLLPKEEACMQCHSEEKEKGHCGMCHRGDASKAAGWPAREAKLHFAHASHLPRVKDDCSRCHKALPDVDASGNVRHVSSTSAAPAQAAPITMDTCMQCHEHQAMYQDGRCDVCHKDLTAERLKPAEGFVHAGNWVVNHRVAARSTNDSCMVCHQQTQCVQCHNATVPIRPELLHPMEPERGFIHRNDWVSRHNIEAQADPAQCYRCHGNNFCSDCHRMQNLTPTGASPRSPHPRGFVQRGGEQFHGDEARRDIQRCAACHDQGPQSLCINCHKVGGVGGNPHPPSWAADHNRNDIRLNSMCQYCHP